MKAISLWQPWASAMAFDWKRNETRDWATSHRGELAIHAAKRWTRAEREFVAFLREHGVAMPYDLPLGAIVCVVTLVDCVPAEDVALDLARAGGWYSDREYNLGNYEPGRFAWITKDVRPLSKPIPFRGAQGFFEVPDELVKVAA